MEHISQTKKYLCFEKCKGNIVIKMPQNNYYILEYKTTLKKFIFFVQVWVVSLTLTMN